MAQPTKIFELKGQDWMKGLSIQSDFAIGGLFASAQYNPFLKLGYMPTVPVNTLIDDTTITSNVTAMASTNSGPDGYILAINDSAIAKTKSFYRIKVSDGSVIDYSDQIDQNASIPITHNGVTYYKGRVIYEQGGSLRSNTLTPTTVNDTNILTSALTGGTDTPIVFARGSDGVMYFTANQGHSIGKILSTTATTGNTASAFTFTDTSLTPKDICNDGVYTIFIADNNPYKTNESNASCRIFFWDTIKTKADIIYDIPDSYVISAKYVDGKVLILGASGIWACNSATAPKLIFPLSTLKLPTDANRVTVQENILYWASSGTLGKVYGYGSTVGKPILFQPFSLSSSDNLANTLVAAGDYFFGSVDAGTNTPKVYSHYTLGTGIGASIITTPVQLNQTYSFSYAKVVLKSPLTAGQSITMGIYNGDGQVIMDTSNKTFAADGAKQTFLFNIKPIAGSVRNFEELYFLVSSTGAIVQRVSIYGVPLPDDNSQII